MKLTRNTSVIAVMITAMIALIACSKKSGEEEVDVNIQEQEVMSPTPTMVPVVDKYPKLEEIYWSFETSEGIASTPVCINVIFISEVRMVMFMLWI